VERKCINRAGAYKKVYLLATVQMNLNMFNGRLSQEQSGQPTCMGTINVGQPENLLKKLTFTPLRIIFRLCSGSQTTLMQEPKTSVNSPSFWALIFDVFLYSFNFSNIHFSRQIIRGSRDSCLAPSLPPPMALSFISGFMPRHIIILAVIREVQIVSCMA
jgi:hypothetical protein